MKPIQEIYIDEVKISTEELGEKFGKILLSDAIRKFTLNCLMKMEAQFHQSSSADKAICEEYDFIIASMQHGTSYLLATENETKRHEQVILWLKERQDEFKSKLTTKK